MSITLLLENHFADLPDPRVKRTRRHLLSDILAIILCATFCGAEGWEDIEQWALLKKDFLISRLGLELPGGVPSDDTLRRVMARLDPKQFQSCFVEWVKSLQNELNQVISLDGKFLRGSEYEADNQSPIVMVSAWAAQSRLVLGQIKTDVKSNEITAVPLLLALLDIEGCTIITDALNTQKEIVKQIRKQKADYLLPVKGNHPSLLEALTLCFDHAQEQKWEDIPHHFHTQTQIDHGRSVTRSCWQIDLDTRPNLWSDKQKEWQGLSSIVKLVRDRRVGEKVTQEVCYYISSLSGCAKQIMMTVQQHWGIENKLHWILDVVFKEDACHIHKDHAPQNLATVRHIVLNLIRQKKADGISLRRQIKMAGWDDDFLFQLLQN